MIGGTSNYTVTTSYTVTGLTTARTYRFRYRAINRVGASGWSPVTYLQPASVPTTPRSPEYVSSTDEYMRLQLFRSEEDGGLPILDYELWTDAGDLASDFTKLSTYVYSRDGFTFNVEKVANSLTAGLIYRFKFRSRNAIGFSEFSDSTRVGMGPLPSTPTAPIRALTGNSDTSIGLEWSPLTA